MCLLLVRAQEDATNSYLRTLKASGLWGVMCGAEAYDQIRSLSGFDLRTWIERNVQWETDLDGAAAEHLRDNSLMAYLEW